MHKFVHTILIAITAALVFVGCSSKDNKGSSKSSNDTKPAAAATGEFVEVDPSLKAVNINAGSKIVFTKNVPDFNEESEQVYVSTCGRLAKPFSGSDSRVGLWDVQRAGSLGKAHEPEVNFCLDENDRWAFINSGDKVFAENGAFTIEKVYVDYKQDGREFLRIDLSKAYLAEQGNKISRLEVFGSNMNEITAAKLMNYHLWGRAQIIVPE